MIKVATVALVSLIISCSSSRDKSSPLIAKTVLPKELKEISGVTAVGENVWAITDKPKARVFKLDANGKLLQTVNVANTEATDVEAVTSDSSFIYIADV